jgi:hypothetical protein
MAIADPFRSDADSLAQPTGAMVNPDQVRQQ